MIKKHSYGAIRLKTQHWQDLALKYQCWLRKNLTTPMFATTMVSKNGSLRFSNKENNKKARFKFQTNAAKIRLICHHL